MGHSRGTDGAQFGAQSRGGPALARNSEETVSGRIENLTALPPAATKTDKQRRNLALKRKPDLKAVAAARKRAQEQLADELIQSRLTEATGNQPDEVADLGGAHVRTRSSLNNSLPEHHQRREAVRQNPPAGGSESFSRQALADGKCEQSRARAEARRREAHASARRR